MKSALLGLGALLAMTAVAAAQPVTQPPPQCWANGVAVPCAPPALAPPPVAGYVASPPQHPSSWYYNPYDAPEYRCHMMCAAGSN